LKRLGMGPIVAVHFAHSRRETAQTLGADVWSTRSGCRPTRRGASYAVGLLFAMGTAEALLEAARRFVHKDVVMARTAVDGAGARFGALGLVIGAVVNRSRPD
jgi:hypothetical protein